MSRITLVLAMASTLLTPVAGHADVGDVAEQPRLERRVARQQGRQPVQRAERGQVRRVDRRIRRSERQVDQRIRRSERQVDRRIRRSEQRFDRPFRRIDRRFGPDLGRVDRRIDRRFNRGGVVGWNRDWRLDRRFDFRRYRLNNRRLFRLGRYDAPFSRPYQRLGVGTRLAPGFYGGRYLLADPYRYRLPPAYGNFRWTRYFNDAVLVDSRSGVVRDVEYDFFY